EFNEQQDHLTAEAGQAESVVTEEAPRTGIGGYSRADLDAIKIGKPAEPAPEPPAPPEPPVSIEPVVKTPMRLDKMRGVVDAPKQSH
ncbi:hypothetical protein ABTE68_20395, partial [Acinetobacter baumannii]